MVEEEAQQLQVGAAEMAAQGKVGAQARVEVLHQGAAAWRVGLSQDWGSRRDSRWRMWIVGWVELLSEAGAERAGAMLELG